MTLVIFPDVEKVLVAYFKSAYQSVGQTVRVGTKKTPPDKTQPAKELVISVAYGRENESVLKTCSVTLEVFASSNEDANTLGLLTESLVRNSVGSVIKKAEVLVGPVRVAEESTREKRYLDVSLVVKGTNP